MNPTWIRLFWTCSNTPDKSVIFMLHIFSDSQRNYSYNFRIFRYTYSSQQGLPLAPSRLRFDDMPPFLLNDLQVPCIHWPNLIIRSRIILFLFSMAVSGLTELFTKNLQTTFETVRCFSTDDFIFRFFKCCRFCYLVV